VDRFYKITAAFFDWKHVDTCDTRNGSAVVKCLCYSTTNGVSLTLNCCSSVKPQTTYILRKVMCRRKNIIQCETIIFVLLIWFILVTDLAVY